MKNAFRIWAVLSVINGISLFARFPDGEESLVLARAIGGAIGVAMCVYLPYGLYLGFRSMFQKAV